jgi:hypothetical protein
MEFLKVPETLNLTGRVQKMGTMPLCLGGIADVFRGGLEGRAGMVGDLFASTRQFICITHTRLLSKFIGHSLKMVLG